MTTTAADSTTATTAADDENPTEEIPAVPADDATPEPVEDQPAEDQPAEDNTEKISSREKMTAAAAAAGTAAAQWWGFVRTPISIREAWRKSGEQDARRIPADSQLLSALWYADNRFGRLALFVVVLALMAIVGTLLWCICTPSRRLGLYVVLFFVLVIVPAVTGG